MADLQPRLAVEDVSADKGSWNTARLTSAPAVIVYTSGSTARPKGAVFGHDAFTFANRAWGGPVMGIKPDDVVLGVLPFAHNYGMNAELLAPLLFGAMVVIVEHFTPEGS